VSITSTGLEGISTATSLAYGGFVQYLVLEFATSMAGFEYLRAKPLVQLREIEAPPFAIVTQRVSRE